MDIYIYVMYRFFLGMHESNIVQYGSPYTANCAAYDFPPSVPVSWRIVIDF